MNKEENFLVVHNGIGQNGNRVAFPFVAHNYLLRNVVTETEYLLLLPLLIHPIYI